MIRSAKPGARMSASWPVRSASRTLCSSSSYSATAAWSSPTEYSRRPLHAEPLAADRNGGSPGAGFSIRWVPSVMT
jgi:hypothetical protein